MDADADCIVPAVQQAPAVDTAAALLQCDIVILRYQEFCVIAESLEPCCDTTCDDSVVPVFSELPVRAALAGRELAVAIVDKDFHKAAGCCSSSRIPDANLRNYQAVGKFSRDFCYALSPLPPRRFNGRNLHG